MFHLFRVIHVARPPRENFFRLQGFDGEPMWTKLLGRYGACAGDINREDPFFLPSFGWEIILQA